MSGEASLEREGLGDTAVLGSCSGLSTNIWVGEAEGKTNVSGNHFVMFLSILTCKVA